MKKNDSLERLLARARKEEKKRQRRQFDDDTYPIPAPEEEENWDFGDYIFFWLVNFLLVLSLLYLLTGDGLAFLSRLFFKN